MTGAIDVSALTELEGLDCDGNSLTVLNVSGLNKLEYLYCEGSELETLDVTGLTQLKTLWVRNNYFTDISDVTGTATITAFTEWGSGSGNFRFFPQRKKPPVNPGFSGGDGTSEMQAFVITTPEQLYYLAYAVNSNNTAYNDKYYRLGNNLDISMYSEWTPIGFLGYYSSDNRYFSGHFDGYGRTISGLTISEPDEEGIGLFGNIYGGSVKNLRLTNVNINGVGDKTYGDWVGGIAGFAEDCKIDNCSVSGIIIGGDNVGGIAGTLQEDYRNTSMTNCTVTADVTGKYWVGGIVGSLRVGLIENCYSTGAVSGRETVGGTVGSASANRGGTAAPMTYSTIRNCYATGNVTGSGYNSDVGGIAGIIESAGDKGNVILQNCYAIGAVSGQDRTGGVVGRIYTWSSGYAALENCYATGAVSGDDNVGGVAGQIYGRSGGKATLQSSAALNPTVKAAGANVGRVLGVTDVSGAGSEYSLSGNIAFSGMTTAGGTAFTLGEEAAHDRRDGASKTLSELQITSGFPANFTSSPWTYEEGKLPGLNGQTVNMPEHLSGAPTTTDAEELFAIRLNVYPNPFADVVRIAGMVVETGRAASLQVINAAGVIVHAQTITNPDETIRLGHLPAGVYFFRVEMKGKTIMVKTVKN